MNGIDALPTLDLSTLPTVFADVPRPSRAAKTLQAVAPLRRSTPERQRLAIIERGRRAAEYLAPLPTPGTELLGVLDASFGGFDLIAAIMELTEPAIVAECWVSTLGFSKANTHQLADLLDRGRILACRFVVSDYYRAADNTAYAELLTMLQARGHQIAVCRTHMKVALLALADGRRFTLEGSMNFRTCNAYEQFILTTDPVVYDHRRHCLEIASQTAAKGATDAN